MSIRAAPYAPDSNLKVGEIASNVSPGVRAIPCGPRPVDEPSATPPEYFEYWEYDEPARCDCCGGEGFVELHDCPELWGEDCCSEVNRLTACPECEGSGVAS